MQMKVRGALVALALKGGLDGCTRKGDRIDQTRTHTHKARQLAKLLNENLR